MSRASIKRQASAVGSAAANDPRNFSSINPTAVSKTIHHIFSTRDMVQSNSNITLSSSECRLSKKRKLLEETLVILKNMSEPPLDKIRSTEIKLIEVMDQLIEELNTEI